VIRPAEYAALLRRHKGSGASILEEESVLFGTDHCQAGRHLVGQCRLPAEFDPIVFEHHCDRRAENPWSMGELIKISCRMADAVGFPAFPGCEIAPFADLQNELPDRERGAFHWEADALAAYVVKRIKALDPA
jgi:hypothetical protein